MKKREMIKPITLSRKDAKDLQTIINTIKLNAENKNDMKEAALMAKLISFIQHAQSKASFTDETIVILLGNEYRFAMWLCVDLYATFITTVFGTDTTEIAWINRLRQAIGGAATTFVD